VIAIGAWMVIWWITEAVPLFVTALLPLVFFPLLGIADMTATAAPYANPIIFLFMGGFLIALAMEKRNLHTRMALTLIRVTGTPANGIILGFMLATAFLSMWISNTATTVMMLPIALSVVNLLRENNPEAEGYHKFALSLMLCIAYSANIGGTATIIGTPPNVVFLGYMKQFYQRDIEFGRWLLIGIPFSITMLTATFFLTTRVLFRHGLGRLTGSAQLVKEKLKALGSMSKAEKLVGVIFFLTAVCWIFQQNINEYLCVFLQTSPGEPCRSYVNNTNIAMAGGILMFITPVNLENHEFVLDWRSTERLPWGILLLFGGGLCLANGTSAPAGMTRPAT
jgi:sodium-dependent dicarboxylate transporter 2/3/5